MVESIKELRKICQKTEQDHPFVRIVMRRISIYFTKLFLLLSMTANQVSVLGGFSGLMAALFFSVGDYYYSLSGALLLFLGYIFDCADGEIARYRETSSAKGDYIDNVCSDFALMIAFVGLSFGVYRTSHNVLAFLFGFLIILSLGEFKTLLGKRVALFANSILKKEKITKPEGIERQISTKKMETSIKKKVLAILKQLSDKIGFIFQEGVVICVILIGAIFNSLYLVLYFYGVAFPLFLLTHVYYQFYGGLEIFMEKLESSLENYQSKGR